MIHKIKIARTATVWFRIPTTKFISLTDRKKDCIKNPAQFATIPAESILY